YVHPRDLPSFPTRRSSDLDIWVKGKPGINAAEVEAELRGVMRSIRKLSPGEKDDFALNRNDIVAQQLEPIFAMVNFAGWVIGLFSILVGGFRSEEHTSELQSREN